MRRLAIALMAAFILAACPHDGADVPAAVPRPDKIPPFMKGEINEKPLRVALYVDTSRSDAPDVLDAVAHYSVRPGENENGNWSMSDPRTAQKRAAYFDYVILSGGEIKLGKYSAYLELSPKLRQILGEYQKLIKPMHDKGIKVLLGVSGGSEGITFGCLPGEFVEEFSGKYEDFFKDSEELADKQIAAETATLIFKKRLKNRGFFAQSAFAQQVGGACKYFRLDGVEFWDNGSVSQAGISPYPQAGKKFFNGEENPNVGPVRNKEDELFNWIKGGGNFTDLFSYVIVLFGTEATFQGEFSGDEYEHPVLVRESNYGRYLSKEVPRFAFSNTLQALTYIVNDSRDTFGSGGGTSSRDEIPLNPFLGDWVKIDKYGPIIIDFAKIADKKLQEYSKRLGEYVMDRGSEGDEEPRPPMTYSYASPYGLVYYENLGKHTDEQMKRLSITSRELFDADVKDVEWEWH